MSRQKMLCYIEKSSFNLLYEITKKIGLLPKVFRVFEKLILIP